MAAGAISGVFAKDAQTYDGGDLGRARRLGSVVWVTTGVFIGVLLPLAPPTENAGGWGWLYAGAMLAGAVVGGAVFRSDRVSLTWNHLLFMSYSGLAQIAILQWAAGGSEAPYALLFPVATIYTACLHPPRRLLVYTAAAVVTALVPLAYEGWDPLVAANTLALLLLTITLSFLATMLMTGVRRQRVEMARQGEEAALLARVDALTGLGNRRAFDEALGAEVAAATGSGEPLALIVGDLDSFKQLNDRHGHLAGDECLRMVADAVRTEIREARTCFRWGGDEFAVVLPGSTEDEAAEVAARLMTAVLTGAHRPSGEPLSITCAFAELERGQDAAGLVASADMALIAAKAANAAAEARYPA